MWGGNAFLYGECEDNTWPDDGTDPIPDTAGNTDCDPYEADPLTCGLYDFSDSATRTSIFVDTICCICGGGSLMQTATVAQD